MVSAVISAIHGSQNSTTLDSQVAFGT